MFRALPLLALLAASLTYGAEYTRDGGTADWMCCADKACATIVSQHADAVRAEKACAKLTDADGITRYTRSQAFRITSSAAPPPPTCGPKPADLTQTAQCPTGTSGTWAQVKTHISAPHPQCWTQSAWTPTEPPAGSCTPIPPADADGDGVPDAQDRCPTLSAATADGCPPPPAGAVANLPVVCTASNVAEGAAVSACAWSSQRFQPATSSSLVRACATASCTTSTTTWRKLSNVAAAGAVEVCTTPKLADDPVVGGSCPTGSGGWGSMSFVPASSVVRAADPTPPPSSAIVFASSVSGTFAALAGKTVSGSIAVKLSDCSAASPIVFAIDDTALNTEFSCPFWLIGDDELYDTRSLSNGSHRIEARTPSATLSATFTVANGTPQPPPDPTPTPGTGQAVIKWTPPTKNVDGSTLVDLAGFRIVYGTSPSVLDKSVQVMNPTATNYTVTQLTAGTWYFAVISVAKTNESNPSGIVQVAVK